MKAMVRPHSRRVVLWRLGSLKWCTWVSLSLIVSFFINWLIAPWAYVPRKSDYFEPKVMPTDVRGQLDHFYWVWEDPKRRKETMQGLREVNPEWDLIGRAFYVYSLANVALQYPDERQRALSMIDLVIEDTLKRPWREYCLPYVNARQFVRSPASSLMVDGEVSLMIGLRRIVEDPHDYKFRAKHRELIERCHASMSDGPLLVAETYPDECWLWCNPLALLSIQVFDLVEGTDHSEFIRKWGEVAAEKLVDKETGLFRSAVTLQGKVVHKSEGSTVWIGAYCLQPVLPDLARRQYDLMKKWFAEDLLFTSYAREWPKGRSGLWDIDSGFTPFGMGPASTGFAMVAAKGFDDQDYFVRLLAFSNLAGVPKYEEGRMRYLSSNLVGDATFLLAKTSGPAWREIEKRMELRRAEQ